MLNVLSLRSRGSAGARLALLAIALFVAGTGVASAQTLYGSIVGNVTDNTGAVVVFTLATSTHTLLGAPANGVMQAGSTKPVQSVAAVHAVVVTLTPNGPLGDAHTDKTYA